MAEQVFNRTPGKTARARHQRSIATRAERRLWSMIRSGQMDGESFRRQHPAGPYILDFYCPRLRLAIEVDGGGHGYYYGAQRDAKRDAWLLENGVLVLRFWNIDVQRNLFGVCDTIRSAVMERAEHVIGPVGRWKPGPPRSAKLRGTKA